jgi:hypothetical protein
MTAENTQDRVEALRQKLASGRTRADSMFTALRQTPAKERPAAPAPQRERVAENALDGQRARAFSFVESIHNHDALHAETREKLKAIMESLQSKKLDSAATATDQFIPLASLPGLPRSKESALT